MIIRSDGYGVSGIRIRRDVIYCLRERQDTVVNAVFLESWSN